MDFKGQKLAEQLCLYIICAAGAVAFIMGWLEGSFALMMKVIKPLRVQCIDQRSQKRWFGRL